MLAGYSKTIRPMDNKKIDLRDVSSERAKQLNQYPQLLQEIFGIDAIEKLNSKDDIKTRANKYLAEGKEFGKIIGACIIASIAYGIIHDQVTARICLEYFSKGFHRRMTDTWDNSPLAPFKKLLAESKSPTMYAFVWGIVATWWVGAILGVPLALAARLGKWPKMELKEILKPIASVLAFMGVSSILTGFYAYFKYRNAKSIPISPDNMQGVDPKNYLSFFVNSCSHEAAYASGIIGGLVCIGYVIYKRYQKAKEQKQLAQEQLLKLVANN